MVIRGSATGLTETTVRFGFALSAADFDGDGAADLAVSLPWRDDGTGAVDLSYGAQASIFGDGFESGGVGAWSSAAE